MISNAYCISQDGAGEQDLDEDALLKKMIEEQNVEWQRCEMIISKIHLCMAHKHIFFCRTQQQRRATNFPPNNQKFGANFISLFMNDLVW